MKRLKPPANKKAEPTKRTNPLTDLEVDQITEKQLANYENQQRSIRATIKFLDVVPFPNNYTAPSPFKIFKKGTLPDRDTITRSEMTYGEHLRLMVRGPALDILAEDVLYGTLKLFDVNEHNRFAVVTDWPTLLKAIGKKDSTEERERIWDRLVRLHNQHLELYRDDTKSEVHYTILTALAKEMAGKKRLLLVINPIFKYQHEGIKGYTLIDTKFRAGLRGDKTKALYRMYQRSYGANKWLKMGIDKILRYAKIKVPEWWSNSQKWHMCLKPLYGELGKGYFTRVKLFEDYQIGVRYAKQEKKPIEVKRIRKRKRKKKQGDTPATKIMRSEQCPHGHRFGLDFEEPLNDWDCHECPLRDKCREAEKAIRGGN